MSRTKIGIIGYGVVGKAISNTLNENFNLIIYDKFGDYDDFENFNKCDFVFIAVPTPFDCKNNKLDDSAILESLDRLAKLEFKGIVIVKSTVSPGHCRKYVSTFGLETVFNPEFLRESTTPNEDFRDQDTIVIGSNTVQTFELVKEMYRKVAVPHAKYYHTSLEEAEMIKCSQNTILASRIALANMIYDACEKNGLDYDKVKEIAFDRFEIIGPHMMKVPGPDGKRGFGGKCLPKDIRAFNSIHYSNLLNEIISYNDSIRDDMGKFLENYDSKFF